MHKTLALQAYNSIISTISHHAFSWKLTSQVQSYYLSCDSVDPIQPL